MSAKWRSRKTGEVFPALVLTEPYERQSQRALLRGVAGDWLLTDRRGDGWPIPAGIIETLYERVED